MRKYLLEIIVFVSGAVVMIFELAGSRVIGPYLGTSIFVWTSLIGVILGSLSLGYWLGGKLADKKPTLTNLSLIILYSAIFIALTIFIKEFILVLLQESLAGVRLSSVLASFILFAPTSILLGMVSPYAVKLKMNNLNTSGSTVGNLYAISTVGSITGTFSAGFYLIPHLGTTKILFLLSITLIILSIAAFSKQFLKIKLAILLAVISFFAAANLLNAAGMQNLVLDIDTDYNRVWIYDYKDSKTGKMARGMKISNEFSSAMFLEGDELVYEYTKYYRLAKHFKPDLKKTLIIGGAAYSYPKDYLKEFPKAAIDVVEIDPKLTELAQKYFKLKKGPRLNIYHEDGRTFLNRTQNKYDVIFGDAFKSFYSLPYQLTTKEAIQKKYDILNDEGAVLVNIISSIEGRRGEFLRAEYATYKSIFPQVYLFPVTAPNSGITLQNIILVALKSDKKPSFESADGELNKYLGHLWTKEIKADMPILTDNYAPVDYYISKTI